MVVRSPIVRAFCGRTYKIFFITGYAENAVISNHLEAGMSVLAKPFAMSTLANKVREMIELN